MRGIFFIGLWEGEFCLGQDDGEKVYRWLTFFLGEILAEALEHGTQIRGCDVAAVALVEHLEHSSVECYYAKDLDWHKYTINYLVLRFVMVK